MTPFCLILLAAILGLPVDEVTPHHGCHSVRFQTNNVHGMFDVAGDVAIVREVIQTSLKVLPEPALVQAVISTGPSVGLSSEQQDQLKLLFADAYRQIVEDEQMSTISSALPYCLSVESVEGGHYFLYIPKRVSKDTDVLVFLHGFGGNFLFYLKVLKDQFPDHIIVLPSWGATWANGNARYIREVYIDVEQRFGIKIGKAHLMSISGGGAISFDIYQQNKVWFKDLTVLASAVAEASVGHLDGDLSILTINGISDDRFPIAFVRERNAELRRAAPMTVSSELPGDHFFFLSDIPGWRNCVRETFGY